MAQNKRKRGANPAVRIDGKADAVSLVRAGLGELKAGRIGPARDCFARAAARDPSNVDAHNALGVCLMQEGDRDAAARAFEAAAACAPAHVDSRVNLANLRCMTGDNAGAIATFRAALALDTNCVEAMSGLGAALRLDGDLIGAELWLTRAIARTGGQPAAHNNLGIVRLENGDREAALMCFRRALAIVPNDADAQANIGLALMGLDRQVEAIAHFEAALAARPGHWDAAFNRALALLSIGRFADGWAAYQLRNPPCPEGTTLSRTPLGPDLAGRRIVVLPDQGLGDEIFFLRFVAELKRRGAWVGYWPSPKIAGMISRVPWLDAVLDPAGPLPEADTFVSVGDLPYLTGHDSIAAIPPTIALAPLPARVDAMRDRLKAAGPRPWTAVTWRAGTRGNRRGLHKQAPADALAGALACAHGTVIAVQRLPEPGEVAGFAGALGRPIADFTALNDDLEDMLALMALADDYVAVSNTNVHMRAAVGATCRVLVPEPPEFRWMAAVLSPSESPWFPGSSLYRQAPDASWDEAFGQLARDLAGPLAGQPDNNRERSHG